jgi:ligand-binding sensor domain-containing protein
MIDESGRVWAVGLGGYSVRDSDGWRGSPEVASLRPRVVYTVREDPRSGAVWLSTNVGAGRLLDGEWTVTDTADGLPHPVVHASLTGADGVTWHACRAGLARVVGGEVEVFFPETNFRSILEGPTGKLWVGSSEGVFRWDGETWARMLGGRTVYPRSVSSDGTIWAGSAASGVFRYSDGEWTAVELPSSLRGAEVFDVAEGPDGSIWLATSKGAYRMEKTDAHGSGARRARWEDRAMASRGGGDIP